MTSHSWKCVTCSQSYRSKKEPTRTPKCPTCGVLLVPDLRAMPSPQPHAVGPRSRAGTASALLNTARQAGGAVGVAAFGALANAGAASSVVSGLQTSAAIAAGLLLTAMALATRVHPSSHARPSEKNETAAH